MSDSIEIPAAATLFIDFPSPFSNLGDATDLRILTMDPDGVESFFPATYSGKNVRLIVDPTMFPKGGTEDDPKIWGLNPKITFSDSEVFKYTEPVSCYVIDNLKIKKPADEF